jgi:hypothetical protein
MTQNSKLKDAFKTSSQRKERAAERVKATKLRLAFGASAKPAKTTKRKPETKLQKAQRAQADKQLKQLATSGIVQSGGTIAARREEIRSLYASAGVSADLGSKLGLRLEKATQRAHQASADRKLSGFLADGALDNAGTQRFHEAEVRDHYAAAGNIVVRGTALDDKINRAARRNAGLQIAAPAL